MDESLMQMAVDAVVGEVHAAEDVIEPVVNEVHSIEDSLKTEVSTVEQTVTYPFEHVKQWIEDSFSVAPHATQQSFYEFIKTRFDDLKSRLGE